MNIGLKIKELRISRGLTQSQLQDITGIDAASLRKYENGQYKAKLKTLEVIADALEVDVEALLMSDLTVTKAMHALFTMYTQYGGDLLTYEIDDVDEDGRPIKQRRVGISFEVLNPFMDSWYNILEAYEKADYEGKDDDLKWIMDNFPYSFTDMEGDSDKIKAIFNLYDDFLDEAEKITLDEEKSKEKKKKELVEHVKIIKNRLKMWSCNRNW